jgi:positive regulator of sigma E activity
VPTLAEYPHLVAQLDPRKNGPLVPEDITYASNKKLWWRCPAGPDHVWAAVVSHRTTRGDGCPFCANQRVSVTNALSKLAPAVARQWHPTKNGDLRPRDVVVGSHKRVWWKCPKGPDHEWRVAVDNRTTAGYGCPFCSGKRATAARNLAVVAPHLVPEWHPTANGALRPQDVTPQSNRHVWWRCPEGADHVWSTTVADRTRGAGCPFCSGHAVSETNSLSKVAPAVARQWHPTKNGDLRPRDVVAGSHLVVWWKCSKGPDHEWRRSVDGRTGTGSGCPFCTGRRASAARNLAVVAPHLVPEWHPTKNGALRPEELTPRSSRHCWWRCELGHEWRTTPRNRVKDGAGCPYCAGHRVTPETSLATLDPALAQQWHPTRNRPLTPAHVTLGSGVDVWWQCPEGPEHVWKTQVVTRQRSGCPFCADRRISSTNSLAVISPEIAAEWHPTKNGDLTPATVTWGSGRRVWWKCPEGPDHEWQTAIANRHHNRCPFCMNRKVSVTNSLAAVEPKVAAEWHPTRNGRLTAHDITRGAHHLVWWRCQFGHEWKATVNHRTAKGVGCPRCRQPHKAVAVTGRRGRSVRLASYEGAHHGRVRHVK